jgi:hypothetical protein
MLDDGNVGALLGEVAAEQDRLRPVAASAPALEETLADLERQVACIEHSLSWRVTTPVRASRAVIAGRRTLVRRARRRLRAHLER